jgi:hypothetical protein
MLVSSCIVRGENRLQSRKRKKWNLGFEGIACVSIVIITTTIVILPRRRSRKKT